MSSIRLWHHYIGILIAPSVIFFALTGALQIFNLHESHEGYEAPALLQKFSALHKDQVFALKDHEHGPEEAAPVGEQHPSAAPEHEEGPSFGTRVLKWFFFFVALALTASTLFGVWMGFAHPRRKRTSLWLLAAGIILPIGLSLI